MLTTPNTLVAFSAGPALTDDEELSQDLVAQSHRLAGRYADRHEQVWKERLYEVFAAHPDTEVRAQVAARCSLGLLRHYIEDPDPYVRWSATRNPFTMDADVQDSLAADPDGRVVLGLLAHCDPGVSAVRVIIAGHHSDAKQLLAARRLRTELIEALAADPDPTVRVIARHNLASRRLRPGAVRLALAEAS